MDGPVHLYPIRVYYEETDAGRMVYHGNYLKFAERARTEMMRVVGLDHIDMIETHGLVFAVHSADVKYLKQAKLDDELLVQTHVAALGGASMTMRQKINRIGVSGVEDAIADLTLKIAIVDEAGRPKRLPGDLSATLKRLRDEKG